MVYLYYEKYWNQELLIGILLLKIKKDDESKENNVKYCISIARKWEAIVFCVWEDIVEVKSRILLTLLGSVYYVAQSYKPV